MRIVIGGGGRIGGALAARLLGEQREVVVVDHDQAVCDRLFEQIGVRTVCGEATDPAALASAGMGAADVAIGVLARDADNLAFAMLARSASATRVMVRMLDSSYRDAYRLAGVRDVIAEADLVVGRLETALHFPRLSGILPLSQGDAILFQLEVRPRSLVAGQTVAQVRARPEFPRECVFISMIDPEGRTELPSGNTVLEPRHTVLLVAKRDHVAAAVAALTAEPGLEDAQLQAVIGAMRKIDFLSSLNEDEVESLARGTLLVRKAKGEVLFRKGDPGSVFYMVLAGQVALGDDGPQATEVVEAGGFFGELSLLTSEPRAKTATAHSACELAGVGLEEFRRVVMANPAVALEISRALGQRLSAAARASPPPRLKLLRW
ncbi:MAG: NAD-binding protein [Deltaproteobacteria bacterium]|nr:NAD-binding protein [Deltaproteobacteria bacterium]